MIAAIPSVMTEGHAIAPFIIGVIVLAFASGFIKPTIAPMIAGLRDCISNTANAEADKIFQISVPSRGHMSRPSIQARGSSWT